MPQFEKVYYQRNFRISEFIYETIGAGIILDVGQEAKQALDECKALVNQYHNENMATSLEHQEPHIPEHLLPEIQVKDNGLSHGSTLEDHINSCTEFGVLESYYLIVKNNPTLKYVYDIKKAELQKKEMKQILDATEALCKK